MYRYNDNGGKEKAIDHTLYTLLHDEPNPEMTIFVFWETLMPNRMVVDRDENGQLYYTYNRDSGNANRVDVLEEGLLQGATPDTSPFFWTLRRVGLRYQMKQWPKGPERKK